MRGLKVSHRNDHLDDETVSDSQALTQALIIIDQPQSIGLSTVYDAALVGQSMLQRAATETHDLADVMNLRELVYSDFARIESEVDEEARLVSEIDELPPESRIIRDKVYSAQEIVEAIPDKAAFLSRVRFCNKEGHQLKFKRVTDWPKIVFESQEGTAYTNLCIYYEDLLQHTAIYYIGDKGETIEIKGDQYYDILGKSQQLRPTRIRISKLGWSIDPRRIIMLCSLQPAGIVQLHVRLDITKASSTT